jgi:O-methyltransferase
MLKMLAKGTNYLFGKVLQRKNVIISSSLGYLNRKREIDKNYFDYVRLSTLELVSFEINNRNLKGNVAELGVYKGKFARYINKYFPTRQLYLFDTFEGFSESDVLVEKKRSYSTGEQDFSETSVESVLKLMPFPQKCIPIKGFFPDSAQNVNDSFAFVSLDADLYEPIHSGLQFFYPKLVEGGYIFVHDFNNANYKGARKAVEEFCIARNIGFVPISDAGGTAIISK